MNPPTPDRPPATAAPPKAAIPIHPPLWDPARRRRGDPAPAPPATVPPAAAAAPPEPAAPTAAAATPPEPAPARPLAAGGRRIPYQPALDGLRALAVLTIMLYHGQVAWSRGGFLSVDLFFVLSGFLITSLLVVEWNESGTLDLAAFWSGRARRLLPALFLMLGGIAAYAALLAPPARLARMRGDALATLAYVANWRFAFTHLSYFEQFGDASPLTHMWSLGIEEQYYLLWPLLLILGLRLVKGNLRALLAWTLVAALASATLMAVLYHPGTDPSRLYYGTDTRAQAPLLGGALALLLASRGPAPLPRPVVEGGGLLGLCGLAAMLVLIPDTAHWMYLGGFALAALVCALLIAAATQDDGSVQRLFATPPLPQIGRVSYGLYLWHWPLFVAITPDRVHLDGTALLGARTAATFVAANLSYHLVELPIRRGALRRRRLARPATVGAFAAVAALLVVTTGPGRLTAGQGGITLGNIGPTQLPTATPQAPAPNRPPAGGGAPAGGNFRVYLAGDSVGFSLGYYYPKGTVPGMTLGGDPDIGCGVARAPIVLGGNAQRVDPKCTTWPTRWREKATQFHADVALLVIGAWEVLDRQVDGRVLRVGTPEYETYLDGELQLAYDTLAPSSRHVAFLDVPCYHQPETGLDKALAETRNDPARGEWLNQVLDRFVAAHADKAVLIGIKRFLCPNGAYVDTVQGVKVRYDGIHFSKDGTRLAWRWLGPQLRRLAASR
ncbi:MAG TPA: acyltransferase [Actinomycetes bacterium]